MQNKLGITEFREVFFENLSTLITNEEHIIQENSFYEEVIYKCFEIYQKENITYSINEILNFFHVFLYSMFLHKPNVNKPEDKITLKY